MSPVNQKLMKKLKSEYGEKKWEEVYYAMENKAKKLISKNNKKS